MIRYRWRTSTFLVTAMLLCVLMTACTGTVPFRQADGTAPVVQWPPPPDPARIVWVRSIETYQDAGISKGFWKKIVDIIAGESGERILKPHGVYCDDKERLFVVDVGSALIHVMDTRNGRYTVIGQGKERVFLTPIGVTEDDNDNLYITDSSAKRIYRYSLKSGRLQPFVTVKLGRPTGIAFNRSNKLLYVVDTVAHQVVVIGLDGRERLRIGTHGDQTGSFHYPTDIFIDARNRLYVTDGLNARIQILHPDGRFIKVFGQPGDTGGTFARPKGVAVDSDGHIYVCDSLFDAVQIFDANGRLLMDFGGNGGGPGHFWMPSGIFIDGKDYIYVADTYNRRIQVFRYLRQDEARRNGAGSGMSTAAVPAGK